MSNPKTEKPNSKGSGLIKDPVDYENFIEMNYASSCEDCAHFALSDETCTFGYKVAPHRKAQQILDIKNIGKMAFCRTIEID